MKRNIVFIPTFHYLSHPLFFNIVEKFSNHEKIYFNPKDPGIWEYNKKGIKKEEILNYFDNYYEIEKEIDYKNNKSNKLQRFFENKKYIRNIKNILNGIKPVAIITTSDMSYSARICNQWANKNNIPVIIIQPSFLDFEITDCKKYRIRYLLFNKILNIPLYKKQTYFGNENKNNYLFLFGEYFKKYYKGKSIYNNIYITGNPVFDKYFTNYKGENDGFYEMLNIPPDKMVITVCTQEIDVVFGVDAFTSLIDMYKSVIVDNEKLFFIIKVHPGEDIEKYNKAFRDLDMNNYKIVKDINLYDIYKITDVQVSVSSYSSFEAVVLGIPIILVNPDNEFKLFDYFNNEIELKANTAEELSKYLRRCLTKEYKEVFKIKREKYLKSKLCYIDGKSGERVVERIEEIIKRRRNK